MPNRNEKEASKVSLDETSNFNFANLKLGQFSMREERERKRCGNVVDSSKTGSTQLLRTEGRRLKGGRGEEGWVEKGNFTGERVQKMGRMGDRVTLSRGERRWMRGEGWMDGWMAKRREREKNFCWKEAGVLRESERERERRAALFGLLENAGWQNANYLALFPACKDACKKRATPLSFHIHTLFPLRLPYPCTLPTRRDALWPGLSVFNFSLSLFRPLLCFFFLFLDRHRWIEFSFIFVGFLWRKGVSRGSLRPNFWIREVEKKGVVCALEIYEEEATQKFLQQDLVNKLRIRLKIELVYS